MAVQFEFYKNPVREGEEDEEVSYHPRVVNLQHVSTQKLAAEIHTATTFGEAEVEAMLMELSRCMGNHLREGRRVHLDGIGYFQVTLRHLRRLKEQEKLQNIGIRTQPIYTPCPGCYGK